MTVSEILRFIFLANFAVILIEYIYSYYKKDGIYSTRGTINNVINGIILMLISPRFYGVYFVLFSSYYNIFNIDLSWQFHWVRFIFCLLFVDLMYYIFHRVHHSIYIFWTLHIVHHSDHKMNLSTAERISWFEQIYIYIFFVPVLLAGFHPIEIFLCFYVLSAYQFYCHSQYIKFPRFFDYIMITPHNHRIHHDQDRQNSNFGGVFSIWDRVFGTYTKEIEHFNPGVKNYKEDSFIKFEFNPIIKYVKHVYEKYSKKNS